MSGDVQAFRASMNKSLGSMSSKSRGSSRGDAREFRGASRGLQEAKVRSNLDSGNVRRSVETDYIGEEEDITKKNPEGI